MWTVVFIIIVILALAFLVWAFLRDRKYLKSPTREALGSELKKEIEEEKRVFSVRKDLFKKALDKADKKFKRGADSG